MGEADGSRITGKAPALTMRIYGVEVYPYENLEDAIKGLERVTNHFEEDFHVRMLGKGYVLCSESTLTDAHSWVASRSVPARAENRQWLFNAVLRGSVNLSDRSPLLKKAYERK